MKARTSGVTLIVGPRASYDGHKSHLIRGEWAMTVDSEAILRYAEADRDLDEKAGEMLLQIVKQVEDKHGIQIAEFRVTIDPSHTQSGWPSVNCVIVREQRAAVAADSDVEPIEG